MRAPDFTLADQHGQSHSLGTYAGKWLVLYFYPKDDTHGCTIEACMFRDGHDDFQALGNVEIVGVSKDSVESHRKFTEKYGLNFTLLSDPDHKIIEAYGAWNHLLGTRRTTFVISPDGVVVKVYEDVTPKEHAAEILADLKDLQASY